MCFGEESISIKRQFFPEHFKFHGFENLKSSIKTWNVDKT